MTCRERLLLEHPVCVNSSFVGGCRGCPHQYGYLKKPSYCSGGSLICDTCWDREIPEEKKTVISKPKPGEWKQLYSEYLSNKDQFLALYNSQYGLFGKTAIKPKDFGIQKVIFNDPATIVIWLNGDKTVVKAVNEPFDKEKGLAMAITKYALGNKGNYYNLLKTFIEEEK